MPSRATERINFGKIKEIVVPPNMIELQTNSYKDFLQAEQEYRSVQVSYVNLVAAFLNHVRDAA